MQGPLSKNKYLRVRLDAPTKQQLEQAAQERGETVSACVRRLLNVAIAAQK